MGRLDSLLEQAALRRWSRVANEADRMDSAALLTVGRRARTLARQLERILHTSESRVSANTDVPRPLHADWAWRPELWSGPVSPSGIAGVANGAGFGQEVKFFHDCPRGEYSVRQRRNAGGQVTAPFGVCIEVYHFGGGFLSLAIDLPREAVEGLSRRHLVRVGAPREMERAVPVYGRLNVRHGPNVAQAVRQFEEDDHVDLDLATMAFDENRVSAAWVDLIFEAPAMNRLILTDVTLSRRPRAEF